MLILVIVPATFYRSSWIDPFIGVLIIYQTGYVIIKHLKANVSFAKALLYIKILKDALIYTISPCPRFTPYRLSPVILLLLPFLKLFII
jgi:hypothetical protein